MRGLIRYIAAMLAVLLLLAAAVTGLLCAVTTELFARTVLLDEALLAKQQALVQDKADELAATWHISAPTLETWTKDAARNAAQALCTWWGEIWTTDGADTTLPVYLDASQERELVAAIMADESFALATETHLRRSTARDEVAYRLDEAVCKAVLPLRRSIIDMALTFVTNSVSLPLVRQAALLAAGALLVLAVLMLLMAHRVCGSALLAAAGTMAVCTVPVALLDIPGMLRQLSPVAAVQGTRTLLAMAVLWLGTALILALAGWLIIAIKNAGRARG